MWNMIYLSLDSLINITFEMLMILLLFKFKRNPVQGLMICALYLIPSEVFSTLSAIYEFVPDHFSQTTGFLIFEILFDYGALILCFFLCIQGPVLRNCGVLMIFSCLQIPFLAVLHLLRKNLAWGPPLHDSDSPGDFMAILITAAGFALGLLTAWLIKRYLWQKVEKIPDLVWSTIYLIDFLFGLILTAPYFDIYLTTNSLATVNVLIYFCIALCLWLLAAIAVFLIHDQLNIRRNRHLLEAEMSLQHAYYESIVQIQFQLRSLRHDLINHLNVLEHLDLVKGGDPNAYRHSFLAHCDQIEARLTEIFQWKELNIREMTDRECYLLYYYLRSVLDRHHLDWKNCQIDKKDTGSSPQLVFRIHGHKPSLLEQIRMYFFLRRDWYFQLVRSVFARKGGMVHWEKGGSTWIFIVTLSS